MKYEPNKILSSANGKDKRKYLGIIVMKGKYKYLVPLSSPKFRKVKIFMIEIIIRY